MERISALNPNTALSPPAGRKEPQGPEKAQPRPRKPAMDEYAPEERPEPSGRYWLGKGGDGQPKVYFDHPEQAAGGPEKAEDTPEPGRANGAECPEKKGEKEERCVGDTGRVDREIEKLKKRREELERQLSAETDPARAERLERQLAQVERELRQKDNDTYRKQHSAFTRLA